ncbi:hypothetical protein [Bradyrhizobium sp. Leo121]|uniref:hypothetical protein n=1 Tax=Bradyrhizobium sp. Leo121 TaxID=1571195 RepID=UPI00102A9166|nr:hypothetical protein [Bradyrhizobium sp. Leo121]RZN35569.1 hypothetical protein CWO90_03520 [Bradyrhizobium sp. Leo121]
MMRDRRSSSVLHTLLRMAEPGEALNAVLDGAFAEAEALLLDRFGAITIADLSAEFSRRHVAHKERNRNAS